MRTWLRSLSYFIGYQYKLLPGAIRRDDAYLLAITTTPDKRTARMGYRPGDGIYWNYYRNQTSTFDFRAAAYNAPVENATILSSISLGARPNSPRTISTLELMRVYSDPIIKSLVKTYTGLLDSVIKAHGFTARAAVVDPDAYSHLMEVRKQMRKSEDALKQKIFKEEVDAYFLTDSPSPDQQPSDQVRN